MAKQTKSKKQDNIGKGRVTPVQVAFIVDRYLSDNSFTESRSTFRSEASSLISKTNVQEAPKSLMSLDAILDEYISLKEQKVILEHEKLKLEEEKCRVQNLVLGMQSVMHAYSNSSQTSTPPPGSISNIGSMDLAPRPNPTLVSPPGYSPYPVLNMKSAPWPPSSSGNVANYSTPSTSVPSQNKRKSSRSVPDAPTISKRTRRHSVAQTPSTSGSKIPFQAQNANNTGLVTEHKISKIESPPTNLAVTNVGVCSSVRESTVAKNLFKQSSPQLQSNSPSPKTPPQDCISQVDNTISPLEKSCLVNSTCGHTPQDKTPSNRAVITSTETVMVSPSKHITCYSVERSHYYSSSPAKAHLKRQGTRDHVKGRLDFGDSDAPMSSDQTTTPDDPNSGSGDDLFDDMANFDMFGPDFSLSEFLVDMDLECGQGTNPSSHTIPGLTHESGVGNSETNQTFAELQSTVTEILCEKDMNIPGQASSTSVKSITKCVTITSPAKIRRSPASDQENLTASN